MRAAQRMCHTSVVREIEVTIPSLPWTWQTILKTGKTLTARPDRTQSANTTLTVAFA